MKPRTTKGKANAKRVVVTTPLVLSRSETDLQYARLCQAGIRAGKMVEARTGIREAYGR
jgi:hypothetical protein